ncbi:MAG: hypothetical protein II309_02090, partial [Bacilli bacterium]|nr:hypothetical protein [Bacilli bacterium]
LLTTDNITSTINNSSDNTQVPTAKATYNLANTKADASHTHNTSDIKGLSIPTKVGELTNDAGYISEVINNLTSTDTDKPLSANQGKILDDTKLNKTDANKLNCVSIDNVSLKEYILTNFTEKGKTYYLIAKTTCTDLPKASNFYITVETPGLYTYKVTAKELNDSNGIYVCAYRTLSSSWTEWEKVCTTTVADVNLIDIKTKLTQLETKTASSILRFPYWNNNPTDTYLQIPAPTTLSKQSPFISITSSQGGCIVLLAGDSTTDYEYNFTKCIRLSHDNLWSHDATDAGTEKLLNVCVDKSNGYIYVKLGANGSVSIMGINEAPVSVTTLPTDVVEIPIVDLTQGKVGGADVGVTTITPVNSAITGTIEYTVKNGICYVSMKDLMSTISSTGLLISTTMPKPSVNCNAVSVSPSGNVAIIYIDKNTAKLNGNFYEKNAKSNCSFSYPVAE